MVLLTSASLLTSQEIVFAMRNALLNIQQTKSNRASLLITNEEDASKSLGNEMRVVVGNSHEPRLSKREPAYTIHDAPSVLMICLTRLYRCHDSEIRKAFKHELSKPALIALIDYLRMNLAKGGWLSKYTDENGAPKGQEVCYESDEICVTAKLLNCAVDSLGSAAWLLSSASSIDIGNAADTIAYMKAEISAALEGIEEAAYLQGMLHEALLYSTTVQHQSNKIPDPRIIKPITISLDNEASLLPIGLKAPTMKIERAKVNAGGAIQERSMRDIGRLKSRKVGPYSFERILI
jgi:hypothetical protein